MATKRPSHPAHHKHQAHASTPVSPEVKVADVFDDVEVETTLPASVKSRYVVEVESVQPPEDTPTAITSALEVSTQVETVTQPEELVPPTPPIANTQSEITQDHGPSIKVENKSGDEPILPRFFEENLQSVPEVENEPEPEPHFSPQQEEEAKQVFEQAVPQAFVADIEQESETSGKRSVVVLILLILGILCLVGGIVALVLTNSSKSTTEVAVASPQPVLATPTPTLEPTPTPQASISAELKKKYSVSVLNGTSIKGLAAKEASIIHQAGYKLGTVGNGDPKTSGTITVPTGQKDIGNDLATLLSNFTLTISESDSATAITIDLNTPNQ